MRAARLVRLIGPVQTVRQLGQPGLRVCRALERTIRQGAKRLEHLIDHLGGGGIVNLLAEILDLLAQFRQLAAQGCRQCGDQAIDLITQAFFQGSQQSGRCPSTPRPVATTSCCTACAPSNRAWPPPESQSWRVSSAVFAGL